ncbi:hypothetical protein HT031_003623 [Scenedesmus sp. PABB004]|nr:hypothetical protein HT031_003623 [Scenedesmus sp. PABB004]
MAPAAAAPPFDEAAEGQALAALGQLAGPAPWRAKEAALAALSGLARERAAELAEAALAAGPSAVLEALLCLMASGRTQPPAKQRAADLLCALCSSRACWLVLSPPSVVGRLMGMACQGGADVRDAAARALWQLSCESAWSPEVLSHAGSAFRVVDLLTEDMQAAPGSTTCLIALRATQHLLHAASGGGDAAERIGARVAEPLCGLLDPARPEAAAAAAELVALLAAAPANRARIVTAGGIARLVGLLRGAGGEAGGPAAPAPSRAASRQQQQQQPEAPPPQVAAAQAALTALATLVHGDPKLASELLAAGVMPGLAQLLRGSAVCAGGALQLMGELASLPEGRRALINCDGLAALEQAAHACPEQQLCRLLAKATKGGAAPGSGGGGAATDAASVLSVWAAGAGVAPQLLAVLVQRCCGPADRKTRKRAMSVLARLLAASRQAQPPTQHAELQRQLLRLGLLPQCAAVLAGVGGGGGAPGPQSSVLEVQLAVTLLGEVATSPEILVARATCAGDAQPPAQSQPGDGRPQSQLSAALTGAAGGAAPGPSPAAAAAIMSSPSFVWKHPAAAAAAFGDLGQLVPALRRGSGCGGDAAGGGAAAARDGPGAVAALLWLLQQLLLSPAHHVASLHEQLLSLVAALAAHREPALLESMIAQGWVQVLWAWLPTGRSLLAVALTQLIQAATAEGGSDADEPQKQQKQQQQQQQPQQQQQQPPPLQWRQGLRSFPIAGEQPPLGPGAKQGSSLAPHLLALLDESLPSLQQTQSALEALAHLCSCSPAAAAVAAQLEAAYQAAAAGGVLAMRVGRQGSGGTSLAGAAASLFSGGAADSPRAAGGPRAVPTPLPQSPRHLPATPLSFASSSSSSGGGSFVAVHAPVLSSSLGNASVLGGGSGGGGSGGGGSGGGGSGGAGGASLVRSSSTGLLSRLGLGGKAAAGPQAKPAAHQAPAAKDRAQAQAAPSGADAAAAAPWAPFAPRAPSTTSAGAAPGEPVEDPGSPMLLLVTLLGEQWAATAAAELLAALAAASPDVCGAAMLEHGVARTLAECMAEVQPNAAGAVAARATLRLAAELGAACPEQLHAAGVAAGVLRMLLGFECDDAGAAARTRATALATLAALTSTGDRQLCAAAAREPVLLPLARWLSGRACPAAAPGAGAAAPDDDAAAAAAVLTALLDAGAVDGAALGGLASDAERSELLGLCLACLNMRLGPGGGGGGGALKPPPPDGTGGARARAVQRAAVRLLRCCVELDARLAEAFLAADGLGQVVSQLSAVVAALAGGADGGGGGGEDTAAGGGGASAHARLVLQVELLALLDSLSLAPGPRRRRAGAAAGAPPPSGAAAAAGRGRGLGRASSRVAAAGGGGAGPRELLLRSKVLATNLITVLAINANVKRQLFLADAVGPLLSLAGELRDPGGPAAEAVRAALAQLGLAYLVPAAGGAGGGGGGGGGGAGAGGGAVP